MIREISIFLMGLGALLTVLGVLVFTQLDRRTPPFLGMARHLALSIPVIAIGGIHLACGVLLAITRWNVWAYIGAASNGLLSLMYFTLIGMTASPSQTMHGCNLMTLLFVGMPIVVAVRVAALSKTR